MRYMFIVVSLLAVTGCSAGRELTRPRPMALAKLNATDAWKQALADNQLQGVLK